MTSRSLLIACVQGGAGNGDGTTDIEDWLGYATASAQSLLDATKQTRVRDGHAYIIMLLLHNAGACL